MGYTISRVLGWLCVPVVFLAPLTAAPSTGLSQSAPSGDLAVLVEGLGNYGRKISTDSQLAQKFFDQGLRLTYGYYFPEAIASFQEAQRHDRENPMIYWGLALAIGPNPNSRFLVFPDDPLGEGGKAIKAARARASKASKAEQALISALYVLSGAYLHPMNSNTRSARFLA